MLLPESVLLGLFPQGLILSKPASWEGADDGVFTVDVSVLGPSLGLLGTCVGEATSALGDRS